MVISAVRLAMRSLCSTVFLCLLLCGCTQDSATTQGGSATIQPAEQAREASGFIAYVVELDNGGSQAVVCYPDEDHKEIVMTREPGESPPHFWILPSDVTRSTPYVWRDGQVVEQKWAPSEHREVYLDSMSGKVVQPDVALGLDEYWRRQLIDLVGDRAVVLEYDTDCDPHHPTAKLYLFRGAEPTELGRVFVQGPVSSSGLGYYSLSPDRNYLSWSGPGGSYWCDLRTARVRAQARTRRGLRDGSGFIEYWQDDAGVSHWELFAADGQRAEGSGEGIVGEISPDCVYWTMINIAEDYDPPRFLQVIPGREPSTETRIAEGLWAIEGTDAQFIFAFRQRHHKEALVYRIRQEGYQKFTLEGNVLGRSRVLTLDDGGRVAFIVRPLSAPIRDDEPFGYVYDDELVIFDFDGNEKLRTEATLMSRARP